MCVDRGFFSKPSLFVATVANELNRAKVESYAIFLLAVAIVALIVKVTSQPDN